MTSAQNICSWGSSWNVLHNFVLREGTSSASSSSSSTPLTNRRYKLQKSSTTVDTADDDYTVVEDVDTDGVLLDAVGDISYSVGSALTCAATQGWSALSNASNSLKQTLL
eukprot:PhM_4_TR12407/c0_g1_i1/m.12169